MAKNKEKAGAGRTIVILLVVLLLLLTAGAYGYGVYYFSSHFLPGSMVNGFNCSYMASEDTEDLLNQRVGAYVLAVETMKNGQEAISAQDVGLSYVSTGIVKQLIKDQDRFTWFLAFNQDKNYDISESLSYNVELMGQAVDNLKCMQPENVVQPVDAQIQDTGDTFEIIPEVMGNALDRTKTEEVISAAMLRGKTSVNLENESCYRKPSVYSTDEQLKANCEKMNQLVKVIITYDFADRTETVDRTLIKNWFGYDEDGNVILDENLVRQYVADLGLKYDTMGQTRTFLTYDNRQVEIKGGDYGWVIDQDEEVKALIAAIESGVTQVREPVYLYSGYSRGTNDIGSTYVEIDLKAKKNEPSWLITCGPYLDQGNLILDEIGQYVADLGLKYDTMGQTRTFLTYDNRQVEIKGGDYGWVIDQDEEVKALIEAIESGVTQVREPVYLYSGYSRGTNDIGSTYVEIDLTNQRLVFYQKGTPIVDTPIVSGNPDIEGCGTPTGCYALDAKESPAVLTGEDYEANVTYWMPFAGNVGIHDASWRSEFGGNLYLWEGSHGCVNVPYDKAAEIYANIEVGMPVVVYE